MNAMLRTILCLQTYYPNRLKYSLCCRLKPNLCYLESAFPIAIPLIRTLSSRILPTNPFHRLRHVTILLYSYIVNCPRLANISTSSSCWQMANNRLVVGCHSRYHTAVYNCICMYVPLIYHFCLLHRWVLLQIKSI